MSQNVGKVSQIIGPVVDVSFDSSSTELPNIYDSLEVSKNDGSTLVLEVQSHVGEDIVRTISMDSTDGLQRGQDVVSTGIRFGTARKYVDDLDKRFTRDH